MSLMDCDICKVKIRDRDILVMDGDKFYHGECWFIQQLKGKQCLTVNADRNVLPLKTQTGLLQENPIVQDPVLIRR